MIDDYLKKLYDDLTKYDRTRQENIEDRDKYLDTMREIKLYLRYGIKFRK